MSVISGLRKNLNETRSFFYQILMSLKDLIDSNINSIKLTLHALKRFQESDLEVKEVLENLRSKFQIVEEYPNDPRGHSVLILVFLEENPIHLVVAPHEDDLIVITAYRPNESEWKNNFSVRM